MPARSRAASTTPSTCPTTGRSPTSQSLVGVQRRRHAHRDPRAARRSRRRSPRLRLALPRGDSAFTTVVVPEVFERPSLSTAIARRRSTFALKLRLLSEPGVVVTDVPVVLDGPRGPNPSEPSPASSSRECRRHRSASIKYTQTLGLDDARAVFFAFDADEAKRIRTDWEREAIDLPLDIAEAPYRDLGDPLQRYLRQLTAEPDVVVSVVMPELIFSGWPRLLHNQRALYIKRLFSFEPQVLLSSVPYHVR